MEKIYISLGADCGSAGALRECGKKTLSFPFDWLVCFHSVSNVFYNDFRGFLNDRIVRNGIECNLNYNIKFFHRELIKDYDNTIQRRVDRLLETLKSSDKEVIFVRRSHDQKHHHEMVRDGFNFPNEIDDVRDMIMLRDILLAKYPNLKFKINLFLQCPYCNRDVQNFDDGRINVRVSTQMHILNQNEEPWAREFANWVATL